MNALRYSTRGLAAGLVVLGCCALVALPPGAGAAEEPERQKQIAEVERQIAELTRKLSDLKGDSGSPAGPEGTIPGAWVKSLKWRCIGPASMGGRITAVAVNEKDPSNYWVATASGGLLHTTNNGTTWEHQFDRENTVSIGDVAVAPSDPRVVWVGTGEANPRNSVSWGDGVYKSTDAGKTWKHMGLKESFQIGKIAIHPTNPDIVYVGALGRLYGPNKERGLYRTTDGGKTWDQVLFLDERTGVLDVQINPADPDLILVAAWERQRDGFDSHPGSEPIADGYDGYDPIKKWGPKGGIYRSKDGGKTFDRVSKGLPSNDTGRIGIDWYRKEPKTAFAIIDCAKIGMGTPPPAAYLGVQGETVQGDNGARLTEITPDGPADKAWLKSGDVVLGFGDKEVKTYDGLVSLIGTTKPGDKVKLKVRRDKEEREVEVTIGDRPDTSGVYLGLQSQPGKGGLEVMQVVPGGPADKAGIKAKDVLQSFDKTPLTDQRQLLRLGREKKAGDKVTFKVQRDKEAKDIVVVLEARPGGRSRTRPYSDRYNGQVENVQKQQGPDSHEYGGVYRSDDFGETWTRVNSLNPRPMYFSQVKVDPSDANNVYVLGIALYRSKDGGKTFKPDGGNGVHPDQHALWINPRDGRHMLVGTDGGFYVTHDGMNHWDHINTQAVGQFYHVAVDKKKPYNVYGGLQDNGSWGGPSRTLRRTGAVNEDWVVVGGGDGFVCRVDAEDPDIVYWESQNGALRRSNLRTGESRGIMPQPPRGKPAYRFNWNTPFILSEHNPKILYCAGNHVFRSLNRGDSPKVISPEITRTKRGSATALAESPRNSDVLYAGTDDGFLWVTRDGGATWKNVTDKLLAGAGLKDHRWVNTIEASRAAEGRVYVVLDGHRSDDDEPHVLVSENFGETWKSLRANLPTGCSRVLREDTQNPNLLYLGTEFGFWVSVNRGDSWTKANNNLPTVAVHEVAIADEAGEIVVATHGRSLWVLDVSALRQMKPSVFDEGVHLFKPQGAISYRREPDKGSIYGVGSRHFYGENPPRGAGIYYALKEKAGKAEVEIRDFTGKAVKRFEVPVEPGLHRVNWDLTRSGLPGRQQALAAPGMYQAVLIVDGKEQAQPLKLEGDPLGSAPLFTEEEEPKKQRSFRPDD